MFRKLIDKIIWHFTHVHEMECLPPDASADKETYWYWHDEECRWCPYRRHVMNHPGDYRSTHQND